MSVEAQVRPPEVFSARVAIILFLVGVFSFSAFITLSTFASDFATGDDGDAHALSKSAIGYSGLIKLERAKGTNVNISRAPLAAGAGSTTLVVLTPETKITHDEISRLGTENVLIVLPKWSVMPSRDHKGWVREAPTDGAAFAKEILEEIAPKTSLHEARGTRTLRLFVEPKAVYAGDPPRELRPGKVEALQTLIGPELTPVVTTESGQIVMALLDDTEEPSVYILAEPDLLNNQGIADIATARTAAALLDLLRDPGSPLTFDVTLNGLERSRSLLRLAFQPPLLAATLSLLIVSAMLAWRAATRSGPTARKGRAIALGKRILADNSAALIRLANRAHTMAPRYAEMVRSVVANHIKIARDANETTAAELDRIAASRNVAHSYSELAAEAASAQTPQASLNAARKLHAWTGDMIRATR